MGFTNTWSFLGGLETRAVGAAVERLEVQRWTSTRSRFAAFRYCPVSVLDLVSDPGRTRVQRSAACTLFHSSLLVFGTFLFSSVGTLQHVCVHTSLIALRG